MIIDNGQTVQLVIAGVHDGPAGRSGRTVAFAPNRAGRPERARGGMVDGAPVRFAPPVLKRLSGLWELRIDD